MAEKTMTGKSTPGRTPQIGKLKETELEAVSGGVIAIIRPEHKSGALDRMQSLLPYIEQK